MGEKWLIDTKPDGTELYLDFETGDIVSIRQRIPESTVAQLEAENHARACEYRPGGQIGNTQRHIQLVSEVPTWLHDKWRRDMGEDWYDQRERWKYKRKQLNSGEFSKFRAGGGQL